MPLAYRPAAIWSASAKAVGWAAALLRHIQSGYVYHYAFTMIVGVVALLAWFNR